MATPFSNIYKHFLSQITDYELIKMEEAAMEENMQLWLMSAIGYFSSCRKDLRQYDLQLSQFTEELDSTEQEILAKFMVSAYVSTFLITEQNLKQAINSRDYRTYSPANQLKALTELKKHIHSEANTLMSRYSYSIHAIKELFK